MGRFVTLVSSVCALALVVGCGAVRDDSCIDGDGDGVCFTEDVDDANAKCGTDATDADRDGACVGFDCDDSTASGAACIDTCVTAYPDADADGFGDESGAVSVCTVGAGYTTDGSLFDCDDTPGSGRTRVPIDFDGDGAHSCDDCDEADPKIGPAMPELCDGIDNDCNPATDETQGDPDGDGLLGCADKCPDQGVPTQITWEWYETNIPVTCACAMGTPTATGTYSFTLNGMAAGASPSTSKQCDCVSAVQQLVTPATGWNPNGLSNTLSFSHAPDPTIRPLLAWVRARIAYPDGTEKVECMFDFGGGDCTAANACDATFCDPSANPSTQCPYPACPVPEYSEPIPTNVDQDRDGAGATCDCNDRAPGRAPDRLEICTNQVDDDCDGMADMADADCVACNRTTASEANTAQLPMQCGNQLDDDCDGLTDADDPDCVGTTCAAAQPINLIRDGVHDRRTGNFDLCRMGPDDATSTACGGKAVQLDHFQLVTVYDPTNAGYRVQYCFDGQVGELLTADTAFTCGADLACAQAFATAGPNNCVTEPATGAHTGTRSIPLVFRGLPACNGGAAVSWRITVLPP